MARPSRPWFRFYVEALWDRKLRRLVPAYRWLWVAVLGVARASPRPGWLLVGDGPATADDLIDAAALSQRDVEGGIAAFLAAGMLELVPYGDGLGVWRVVRWDERQFEGDSSTPRTSKHRSKEEDRNGLTPLPGTSPETETETESEGSTREVPFEHEFVEAWAHYPRKIGRKAALAAYQATRRRGETAAEILEGVKHYAAECERAGTGTRFIKHGATFFGPHEWWREREITVDGPPSNGRARGARVEPDFTGRSS